MLDYNYRGVSEKEEDMGLFNKKETDEQIANRIAKNAGHVVAMFRDYFNTPKGFDARTALIFTAALAGVACHEAVKAEKGTFAVITDKAGRNYYFGDDLNKYLLEGNLNVVGFCSVVSGVSREDVLAIVTAFTSSVGSEDLTVCGFDPKTLYNQVYNCWEGIYQNMTSKYCKSPSEWPVLFGIVVQNILMIAIQAGAPKDEAGKIAIESAVAVSKMDKDSFLN